MAADPAPAPLTPTAALQRAVALIEAAPESAAALTLYALATTLEYQRAGCLFKLTKLRDLPSAERPVAFGLMALLAEDGVGTEAWREAKARMDHAIRGG